MAKNVIPITAVSKKPAAAKPAAPAKPSALSADQQAMATLAKTLGVKISMDGAVEKPAEVQTTELSNGALLYHDGALAVAVYNDEALTEATAAGNSQRSSCTPAGGSGLGS